VIFTALPLAGAYAIEPEPAADERGFFARLWCAREFAARGLRADFVQSSISSNRRRGTLRGLHYQLPPHAESKLVRCIRGAAFDVIVDLRPESLTYLQWHACELTADNGHAVYIPEGLAHGFQTLADDTELLYEIAPDHSSEHGRGIHWNDQRLGITWPITPPVIVSQKDQQLPKLAA
jgi:dTDP-4-dehydrorhamnose 3,5-epimerase